MRSKYSSSYSDNELQLLKYLAASVKPMRIVEIGAQKGASTQMLAQALEDGGQIITIDLFEEKYLEPPYGPTHSDYSRVVRLMDGEVLRRTLLGERFNYDVIKGNAAEHQDDIGPCDVLHIDICNHLGNLEEIGLEVWVRKSRFTILEGGRRNSWQTMGGFKPYTSLLERFRGWADISTLAFDEDHGMTLIIPKERNKDA